VAVTRYQDFLSLHQENSNLKENLASRKLIERAKGLLMEQRELSEEQAYTLIKKTSMNMRKPMVDVAQAILLAGGILKDKN
jgi:AmiR/NasT family two-component response regulator